MLLEGGILAVLVLLGCHNKIPLTGWFKQCLFLTVLEAESKIKVWQTQCLVRAPSPGGHTATDLLWPHVEETSGRVRLWGLFL